MELSLDPAVAGLGLVVLGVVLMLVAARGGPRLRARDLSGTVVQAGSVRGDVRVGSQGDAAPRGAGERGPDRAGRWIGIVGALFSLGGLVLTLWGLLR
jgi:hypothetical protein